jgi:hypothetical protein
MVVVVVVVVVVVLFIFNTSSSQHNVISTVTRLQGGQSYVCISWQGQQIYFFLQSVQSSSGAYPALYSVSTRSKAASTWGWPLSSYSAKVNNGWSYASTSSSCLHGMYGDGLNIFINIYMPNLAYLLILCN